MRNDVLDAEKPMLIAAEYIEAYHAHQASFGVNLSGPLSNRAHVAAAASRVCAADRALTELDPARVRQLGTLLGQLRPLAVTASSSTGTASEVRAARDELVKLCLELGGEA